MHFERDMLHSVVIPELISRFSDKRINVDLVDLRWGIEVSDNSSEEESSTKILKVCFDEIERSKPFFIGFIGERYGWIPNFSNIESSSFGFDFSNMKGDISVTEMEMLYALQNFDSPKSCLFFIRNGLKAEDIKDEKTRRIYFPTESTDEKCNQLKSLLREQYRDSTFDYDCYWDSETNSIKGLEPLCTIIIEKLSAIIESEISQDVIVDDCVLANEKRIQEVVLSDIAANTFGREKDVERLLEFVHHSEKKELLVSGVSGLGKSSLMAVFCQKCAENALVIPFFTGISAYSKSFSFLARYVYSVLTNSNDDEILSLDYSEIKKRLINTLASFSNKEKIVIVVDALDQFISCKDLHELDWINEQLLPDNVKIVYSALPEFIPHVKKREIEIFCLDYLCDEDIKLVASGTALKLHKELSENVLTTLVEKRSSNGLQICSDPLYLILLLELLCSFDYEDFVEISAIQTNEGLTPSTAIQTYLSRAIVRTGESVSLLLKEICKKSILQLGKKYDVITSLLTAKQNGMSEREIIGITAYTDTPVSTMDFSLYRRMFRMHLVQRENGNWDFSHAKIQKEQEYYVEGLDKRELYQAAVKYYSALPFEDKNKLEGIACFYGKLEKYREVLPYILNIKAGEQALKLLVACGAQPLLNVCSEKEVVSLCSIALNQAKAFSEANTHELLNTFVQFIDKINQYNVKEHVLLLSDLYEYCGILLFEDKDSRAGSFFEISLNILIKANIDAKICSKRALETCQHFKLLDKFDIAQKCAKIALRSAKANNQEELYVRACLELCQIVDKNPLTLLKLKKGHYLSSAIQTASKMNFSDLGLLCAIEYKKLGKIFKNKKIDLLATSLIENANDKMLSTVASAKKYLYQAQQNNCENCYEKAIEKATEIFAQNSNVETTLLYQSILDKYLYYLVSEGKNKPKATQILQKLDGVNNKLYLMTGDVSFVDNRVITLKDFENCFGKVSFGEQIKNQTNKNINRELKNYKKGSKRDKEIYIGLGFKILVVVFVFILFIELSRWVDIKYVSPSTVLIATLWVANNLLMSIINVLLAVSVFFILLLFSAPSKDTFDYKMDRKILRTLSICILFLFIVSIFTICITMAKQYERPITVFRISQGITFLSYIFACSIMYFMAYALYVFVKRPFAKNSFNKTRYLHNGKFMSIKHLKMLGLTLIPMAFFIPMWNYKPATDVQIYLDYFETSPSLVAKLCYIPFVLQGLLCLLERVVARKRFGKAQHFVKREIECGQAKPRIKAFAKTFSVILTICLTLTIVFACAQEVAIITYANEQGRSYYKSYIYQLNLVDGEECVNVDYYYGYKNKLDIPSTIAGYPVYSVVSLPKDRLIEVTLSEGIERLGNNVFDSSKTLEKIVLPQTINKIGNLAFNDCNLLRTIIFCGTVEQFNAIEKGTNWAKGILTTFVQCSNGRVNLA